ncbi:tumor necrosis factor receptor superfamily member 14-like [Halichoeres trimaculatus]|uniref:tumor necrosis factor receptor superfamily member 14-like n=1 Tax=Halichoeres trimaculatus TaxID=147232 RepID=UPI003D9DDB78
MILMRILLSSTSLLIFKMKASSGQTLTCHRTEYQVGNECCPMCGVGHRVKTDCEGEKSTSCQPCSDQTFMNKLNGLRSCFPCSVCEEASGLRMKRSCTRISDAVCEPLEGFFCTQLSEDGCGAAQRHRSCDPGHYISQRGNSVSDSECSPCSEGTFSDGTFTSCQKHTECDPSNQQLLRPGTGSQDAECGELEPNRTKEIAGGVVGGVVVFVLVVLCLSAWCYRKKINSFLTRGKKEEKKNGRQDTGKEEELNLDPA